MHDYVAKFKQIRVEKGMSLEDAAIHLEMKEGLLQMIETGEMVPTDSQLEAMINFVLDAI